MGKISFVDYTLEVDQNILLEKVNITFNNGNTYFINGKNGCGKSTFLKTITKEYPNYTGEIFIDGTNLKDINVEELFTTYISYLPQVYETKNPLSFRQMVKTLYPDIEQEKLENIIEELDLVKLVKSPFKKLSGGQQQRIMFAFHILSDCPIIILDEFENNLDPEYLEKVVNIIEKENRLLLIVSHSSNIKNSINVNFEDSKLIIEESNTNETDFKINERKVKKSKIFSLFFTSSPIFHAIYFVALASIFLIAIVTSFKNIDEFHSEYAPEEGYAEKTNDTSMAVFCSGCVSYQSLQYASEDIPSNELYFDYEDYETLQNTEGVEEVIITGNPYSGGGTTAFDGFKPISIEFEYEGIQYTTNTSSFSFPKELAIKMPTVYGETTPTYGELPDDNTEEIIVDEMIAYAYYGSDVNLEEKVGTTIELTDVNGETREFIISGFHNDTTTRIYYSYHDDEPANIENNLYLAAQSTDEEVKNEAIDSAYNKARSYSEVLSYDEFITDNPDMIQGFYIELEDPKYMDEVEDLVWSKYPSAVIYDDNVYNTHPPLNTLMPIFRNLIKKLVIILVATIIILILILFANNVQRNDLKQFLLRNGVSKKMINRVELLDTSTTVIFTFIAALLTCMIFDSGELFYFGTMLFFLILIVVVIVLDVIIKKVLGKVKNVKS